MLLAATFLSSNGNHNVFQCDAIQTQYSAKASLLAQYSAIASLRAHHSIIPIVSEVY